MDFEFDATTERLRTELAAFMDEHVYPAERVFLEQAESGDPWGTPPVIEDLKRAARERGLWNLFLPESEHGAGLTNLQYAPLAEIMGRSPAIAPEACNCSAPDTGNMEVLAGFGTDEQRKRWLHPLLEGEIRSGFCMTEPDVASSDARNIGTRIERDGDHYVINGRKWWTTGALSPRCEVLIVMGKTDPEGEPHRQQSMVLVPRETPGVEVVRNIPTLNHVANIGHCEVIFRNVRVPVENLLGEEGGGFAMSQARLGPGRIHHCMRGIGLAEVSLELMCERAKDRKAFGKYLAEHGSVGDAIAHSRIEIDQARLLVLRAAWLIDTVGAAGARKEISMIKAAVPSVLTRVADRAIQIHGAMGVSPDTPLADIYTTGRTLRIVDGPDAVHLRVVARAELGDGDGRRARLTSYLAA